MDVVVVGGGIAGLATAAFLRQRTEARIRVLERASDIVPKACSSSNDGETTDYGIAVAPNGSTCLSLLGMKDHVNELRGSELTEILVRTADNDQSIVGQPFPGRQLFGVPSVFCRRSALLQWLYDRCVEERQDGRQKVEFTTNCQVKDIDAAQGKVTTVENVVFTSDLVICADGIAKAGRKAVTAALRKEKASDEGEESEFIVQCIYMANVSPAELEDRPSLRFLLHGDPRIAASCTGKSTLANWHHGHPALDANEEESIKAWRQQLRFILYPVDSQGNHQLFATVPATPDLLKKFGRKVEEKEEDNDDRGQEQKKSILRNLDSKPVYEAYHMFHEDVRSLLRVRDQMDLGLMRDSDPLFAWSVAGKTVLVGDAAHASIQHTGQGSAQALEDAETLSYFLAQYLQRKPTTRAGISQALDDYQRLRVPRAHRIQHAARMACGMAPGMEKFDFAEYNMYVHAWPGTKVALLRQPQVNVDGQP